MFEFIKKHKILSIVILTIVVLISVFVIPILINLAYECPAPFSFLEVNWEAKDALAFYGSFLGAFATIVALIFTIWFTVRSQKEERKLSVKPRLVSELKKYTGDLLTIDENDNIVYVEYKRALLVSGKSVPDDIASIIDFKTKYVNEAANKDHLVKTITEFSLKDMKQNFLQNNFIMLYTLKNYGSNNAIEIDFDLDGSSVWEFCISPNETKRFVLVLNEDLLVNDRKEIKISLKYTDVFSIARYLQKEDFTFARINSEFCFTRTRRYGLSRPMEI